jgi:Trypsin-like serine proteases, typically periplasmic, contain C-terminal PDZ domain
MRTFFLGGVLSGIAVLSALRADVAELWEERLRTVVAVEHYVETETERRPSVSYGTVIDENGTIILPSIAVNARSTPSQLKDFKVYRAGSAESVAGEYLGQDPLSGWHFVRAAETVRGELTPITKFVSEAREPKMGEELWGIGLRNKDEDFMPYWMSGRVSLVQSLPMRTAVALDEVTGPGLPAFDAEGKFMGLGLTGFGESFLQFSSSDRGGLPVLMMNVEESAALLTTPEVLPQLGRVPQNKFGRPLAWLGAYGLEPVDPEVARFLKLGSQSAVVFSEVVEGGPAARGGLKEGDVLLAIDGQALPRFRPDRGVVQFVGREIVRRKPGDEITLTVLRNGERQDVTIALGDQPKLLREAERQYFDRIGFTAREFVHDDAVARRVNPQGRERRGGAFREAEWAGVDGRTADG